jgi:hypothetical protein
VRLEQVTACNDPAASDLADKTVRKAPVFGTLYIYIYIYIYVTNNMLGYI